MKTRLWRSKKLAGGVSLLLALALVILATPVLAAPPAPPHQFWGEVKINGEPAPWGTQITAKINGVAYASTRVDAQGTYGCCPLFKVPVDDPDTQAIEGGRDNEIVELYVGNQKAAEHSFHQLTSTELNLYTGKMTLTVTARPPEGGTVTGGGEYDPGVQAPITAQAGPERSFLGWIGRSIADHSSPSTTVKMNASKTVTAVFTDIDWEVAGTISLDKGWNTFSVPVVLHPETDTWGDFAGLNSLMDTARVIYYWNSIEQSWGLVDASYPLAPLEGFYIYMDQADSVTLLCASGETAVPSRELSAGGNLIGPASQGDMDVIASLQSVYQSQGGTGYTQVISPPENAAAWTYVRDQQPAPVMHPAEAYWVVMENPATLNAP